MTKPKILVTGARGFIGNAVTQSLLQTGHKVIASARKIPETPISVLSSVADNLTWQTVG